MDQNHELIKLLDGMMFGALDNSGLKRYLNKVIIWESVFIVAMSIMIYIKGV